MSSYVLTPEAIDKISTEVEEFCKASKVTPKETIRMKLTVEEALLHYLHGVGDECAVEVSTSRFFSRGKINISLKCKMSNPFLSEDTFGIMQSLMATEQKGPQWRYADGYNLLTFSVITNKHMSNLAKIGIALPLGIIFGLIGRLTSLNGFCTSLVENYTYPVANAYTGILCVMAIMLVFFTFPLGVVQAGNTSAFHKLSKRILTSYALIPLSLLVLTTLVCVPFMNIYDGGANSSGVLKSALDVFLEFIPTNIVNPFINFNCMQVLIIGLMFGFSFLAMGEKSRSIVSAFDKINLVAVFTNNYLTKIIHIYVGITAFNIIVTSDTSAFIPLLKILPIFAGATVLLCAVLVSAVCIKMRINPGILLRKLLPSFLVNFSSASVGASFVTFFNEMAFDCGIDISYTTISCNLGTVLFKPIYSVFLCVSSLIMSGAAGMKVTPMWVMTVIILSLLLSLSIPNIPGGAASVIILMFSQLGFSSGVCETVVSFNILLQFIIVPVNIFCMQCLSILLADKQKLIDVNVLKAPVKK